VADQVATRIVEIAEEFAPDETIFRTAIHAIDAMKMSVTSRRLPAPSI
jgi:vacuolar-type H+-ATPase subunit B/Vma2